MLLWDRYSFVRYLLITCFDYVDKVDLPNSSCSPGGRFWWIFLHCLWGTWIWFCMYEHLEFQIEFFVLFSCVIRVWCQRYFWRCWWRSGGFRCFNCTCRQSLVDWTLWWYVSEHVEECNGHIYYIYIKLLRELCSMFPLSWIPSSLRA